MFDLATIHPLIVHAPLVLLPIAVLFMLASLFFPHTGLRLAAILLLAGGVATAVIATETGEAAEHRAERVSPGADEIKDPGFVPATVADGQLLETHAKLGELTRNIYALLLVVEAGLFFFTEPFFERWRRGRALPSGLARAIRGLWIAAAVAGIVVVVLTGHYGGQLVYGHAVGTLHDAPSSSYIQAP